MKKYYDRLKLDTNASLDQAKKAYIREIKKYHPDLYPAGEKKMAEEKTVEINMAYEIVVKDIENRNELARNEAKEKLDKLKKNIEKEKQKEEERKRSYDEKLKQEAMRKAEDAKRAEAERLRQEAEKIQEEKRRTEEKRRQEENFKKTKINSAGSMKKTTNSHSKDDKYNKNKKTQPPKDISSKGTTGAHKQKEKVTIMNPARGETVSDDFLNGFESVDHDYNSTYFKYRDTYDSNNENGKFTYEDYIEKEMKFAEEKTERNSEYINPNSFLDVYDSTTEEKEDKIIDQSGRKITNYFVVGLVLITILLVILLAI